ncbi:MAG: HAD family hydrolase [Elusimicrobia bacterium]|nr:HAD family hydrolase [Elusimicrobiota bacterium]
MPKRTPRSRQPTRSDLPQGGRARGIAGILFDLDGVLVDTYAVWQSLVADVAARLGYSPPTSSQFRSSWGQGIEDDVRTFFTRHTVAQVRAAYEEHYASHLGRVRVMEGARTALKSLPQPKAVVSNTPHRLIELTLRLAGLDRHFQAVLGPDDVGASKPAPDMLFEACRRLAVRPRDAMMVGDSDYDEKAAAAAKIPFIRFTGFPLPGLDQPR